MKKFKYVLLTAALVGGLTVGVLSFAADAPKTKDGKPAAPASAPVLVVPVMKQDIAQTVSTVGSLLASESADIHSEVAGKIEKINFEEGTPVKKGDVLLEIDSSLLKADLSKADAAYRVTAATLGRDKQLYSSKYISTQELDESKSTLQQRKAEMDSARILLDKAMVKAPFDGLVGLRNFSVGDYVAVGKVLTTIDAYDPIKIEFAVPERNFSMLRTDQDITFTTDAWPSVTFKGKIYAIDSRINPDTRSFQVKATADNADGKLRAGMYARINIETAVAKDMLVIPEESLSSKGDQDFVFVVQDGKAVMKTVKVLSRQQSKAAVDGLAEGEQVITAGVQRVRDGMPVAIQQPDPRPNDAPAATPDTAAQPKS